jgi:hypothetical protein
MHPTDLHARRSDTFPLLRALGAAAALHAAAAADVVVLVPVQDNTVIQDPSGDYSAGKAQYFFVGKVGVNGGNTLRRGAVQFDLSAIPEGSTIQSASLRLYCGAAGTSAQYAVSLRRFSASWGEGASVAFGGGGAFAEPGDVTWSHRFYPDVLWSTPGGEFAATASATRNVGSIGSYTWASTPGLVADVQGWLDAPKSNHGWCLVGNESVGQSVKRFDSREAGATTRPQLTVVFEPPSANPFDLDGDGQVGGADLAILLDQWGTSGSADFDGNGAVGGADLAQLLDAWG